MVLLEVWKKRKKYIRELQPLVEVVNIFLITIVFALTALMISHLLVRGEFGFCYWSLRGGWIWS